MILCDIGNNKFHFWNDGRVSNIPVGESIKAFRDKKVYYASVNSSATKKLQENSNAIDLEPFVSFDTGYTDVGIDRVLACSTIDNGIVVDVGSAITIDVMQSGVHIGGCILPGLSCYEKIFPSISEKLNKKLSYGVRTDLLPTRTSDAMSYGVIQSIKLLITDISKNKNIYFTGGDGKFLSRLFNRSLFDGDMIFRGMRKVIKLNNL